MSAHALRFARVIANSVHECAPDHSTHTIAVGELREAVAEMEALYDALELADATLRGANMNRNVVERKVSAALKLVRGEQMARANARATADAPDMVEALEAIRGMLSGYAGQPNDLGDVFKIADAALNSDAPAQFIGRAA